MDLFLLEIHLPSDNPATSGLRVQGPFAPFPSLEASGLASCGLPTPALSLGRCGHSAVSVACACSSPAAPIWAQVSQTMAHGGHSLAAGGLWPGFGTAHVLSLSPAPCHRPKQEEVPPGVENVS